MKKTYFLVLCIFLILFASAQPYAIWTKTELKLSNGIVERTIKLPAAKGNFITSLYKPVYGDFKYFTKTNTDFQFEINDKIYSGWKEMYRLVNLDKTFLSSTYFPYHLASFKRT